MAIHPVAVLLAGHNEVGEIRAWLLAALRSRFAGGKHPEDDFHRSRFAPILQNFLLNSFNWKSTCQASFFYAPSRINGGWNTLRQDNFRWEDIQEVSAEHEVENSRTSVGFA